MKFVILTVASSPITVASRFIVENPSLLLFPIIGYFIIGWIGDPRIEWLSYDKDGTTRAAGNA